MNTETPLAAVQQYIDAFNRGGMPLLWQRLLMSVVKFLMVAPHVWQGPTATSDWHRDVLSEGEAHGASGYFVTLGEPPHNNVTKDSAYVVVPATMKFEVKGTKVMQSGAFFYGRVAGNGGWLACGCVVMD